MALPEFLILDVGHGNCAVLLDTGGATVIDCAPGVTLVETLEQLGVSEIPLVLISHADQDHIGGLIGLLQNPDITVHHVFLNPDAMKGTEIWLDVKYALREARKTKGTLIHPSLASDLTGSLDNGVVHVEVLAPSPELALGGVGGSDLQGRTLTANSMSAVIRLIDNQPRVLFTGDLDWVGFQNLIEDQVDVRAEVLIFPHHGGRPGGVNPKEFATQLSSRVQPRLVVFSVGRSRAGFPRPEVVEGVKEAAPDAHIACTQLAQDCSTDAQTEHGHLVNFPSKGKGKNRCCAGTIHIDMGEERRYDSFIAGHRTFVASIAPTMCHREARTDHTPMVAESAPKN